MSVSKVSHSPAVLQGSVRTKCNFVWTQRFWIALHCSTLNLDAHNDVFTSGCSGVLYGLIKVPTSKCTVLHSAMYCILLHSLIYWHQTVESSSTSVQFNTECDRECKRESDGVIDMDTVTVLLNRQLYIVRCTLSWNRCTNTWTCKCVFTIYMEDGSGLSILA